MNYKKKYKSIKKEYLNLKNKNYNKCEILETDKIFFGNGGSSAIVVISKDKKVYKIFTTYSFNFYDEDEKSGNIEKINKRTENEIKIYEFLTKDIIDKNISNHIVKYISTGSCSNAKALFKKCPNSYVEFLKMSDEKKSMMCKQFFKSYPEMKLENKYKVVEIEYCDYSCSDFIKDVSSLSILEMEQCLDIFFFQIIYTIMSIKKIYPYFIHNDFFMRNILGKKEKNNNNYYTYVFNNKSYFVPQKIFFPKINDFGYTNLNDDYRDVKLHKSDYKDIYNLLYDVYDGNNIGGTSLSELCRNDQNKTTFIKSYFSNYFNVNVIDEYIKNSQENIDWNWSNAIDKQFINSIEMKNPNDLLDGYFYDIFNKINTNIQVFKN